MKEPSSLDKRVASTQKQLREFLLQLKATRERRLLLLLGNVADSSPFTDTLSQCYDTAQTLTISNQALPIQGQSIPAGQLKGYLGTEVELIVWNAHDGLDPNALGAASGLVKGGGVLCLLLPFLDEWSSAPDPDYLRMCSFEEDLARCSTFFLKRLCSTLMNTPSVISIDCYEVSTNFASSLDTSTFLAADPSMDTGTLLPDQEQALSAIKQFSKGHRNRPLVITADRGRGKTSLLGIAAAKLSKEILITAPQKRSVNKAFEHFDHEADESSEARLTFMPVDEIINLRPKADLLFVDEAAAIPVHQLNALIEHYPRVLFSSTIHGYEGNGQGFAVRFKQVLNERCPGWKALRLESPIRWAQGDPLESLIFELLVLDADERQIARSSFDHSALTLRPLEQSGLVDHETQLREIMALLVLAHYQTSPSDLRMLMDHPDIRIYVCEDSRGILGIVLGMIEDLSHVQDLHPAIANGQRRLKGHIAPQALAQAYGNTDLLAKRWFRILRIAVKPDCFGNGIGSFMIKAVNEHAIKNKAHFLSVSYGYTSSLHRFWQGLGFSTLRLGYHSDKSSGTNSVIAAQSLEDSKHLLSLRNQFNKHLEFGLTRYYQDISAEMVLSFLAESQTPSLSSKRLPNRIDAFINEALSEYDALPELEVLILDAAKSASFNGLSDIQSKLLVLRILQYKSWPECVERLGLKGKKEGLSELKNAVGNLLNRDVASP